MNGPAVVNVLTIETSADAAAVPPLPLLSELLFVFGSVSVAETVVLLSNAPAALIVAVTVSTTFAPELMLGIVQGGNGVEQPPPLTVVIVRFVGVSVTCTLVAVDGPERKSVV